MTPTHYFWNPDSHYDPDPDPPEPPDEFDIADQKYAEMKEAGDD
jgi:hypothetical protein